MKLLLLHAVVNLAYETSYVGRLGFRRVVVHPCFEVPNFAIENCSIVLFCRRLRIFSPPPFSLPFDPFYFPMILFFVSMPWAGRVKFDVAGEAKRGFASIWPITFM